MDFRAAAQPALLHACRVELLYRYDTGGYLLQGVGVDVTTTVAALVDPLIAVFNV